MTTATQIHHQAIRENPAVIAQSLQEAVGQRLAAYGAQIKDPKQIGRYARGDRNPSDQTAARLRDVYGVVQMLLTAETPETVRAWLIGSNPQLGDEAPVEVLHTGEAARVMRAAEAFVLGG